MCGRARSVANVLTGKVEIQVEISNHWRYAAITDRCCMTHRDTVDGDELMLLRAAQFNAHFQILQLPDRSVHVVEVSDYPNDGYLNG